MQPDLPTQEPKEDKHEREISTGQLLAQRLNQLALEKP